MYSRQFKHKLIDLHHYGVSLCTLSEAYNFPYSTMCEWCKLEKIQSENEKLQQKLTVVLNSKQHMSEIIDTLIDFIESDKQFNQHI